MVVLRLGFGNVTVNEVRNIIDKMGKVVIDIGDGLTLLHVAAQYNHCEMIQYLCEEKNHPLEVSLSSHEINQPYYVLSS